MGGKKEEWGGFWIPEWMGSPRRGFFRGKGGVAWVGSPMKMGKTVFRQKGEKKVGASPKEVRIGEERGNRMEMGELFRRAIFTVLSVGDRRLESDSITPTTLRTPEWRGDERQDVFSPVLKNSRHGLFQKWFGIKIPPINRRRNVGEDVPERFLQAVKERATFPVNRTPSPLLIFHLRVPTRHRRDVLPREEPVEKRSDLLRRFGTTVSE